jgi:uncharacterized membrane protein YvbJ
MAMTKCPECGTEVSDKAEKCPKCAYPISGQSSAEKVQIIEQTSKRLKKQMIFAILAMILGLIIAISSSTNNSTGGSVFGMLLIITGIIWVITVKIKIWWHHK